MATKLSFNDKVFSYLIHDLKEGEEKEVRLLASPETRSRFVESVITFIQCEFGESLYGFYIELSEDRSKIRKRKLYIPNEKVN